jgi:DNA repair ATPase RecN
VTLEKGEGHGCYRLSQGGSEKEFTKLAGEVPSEVSKSLELDPVKEGLSLNFAPQHEPPFLLTASGSAVARSLGELTKVSTVLEAVREANRRRMSASSDLKLRAKDLEGIGNAADILSSLNARKDAIHAADKLMADIKSLETEILKLDSIVGSLEKLDVQVADIYDMSDLLNAYQDFNSLYKALQELHKCTTEVITCTRFYDSWAERSEVLEKELHDTLAEIGECPLCGQEISK